MAQEDLRREQGRRDPRLQAAIQAQEDWRSPHLRPKSNASAASWKPSGAAMKAEEAETEAEVTGCNPSPDDSRPPPRLPPGRRAGAGVAGHHRPGRRRRRAGPGRAGDGARPPALASLGRRPGRGRGPGRAAPRGGDRASNAWTSTAGGRSGPSGALAGALRRSRPRFGPELPVPRERRGEAGGPAGGSALGGRRPPRGRAAKALAPDRSTGSRAGWRPDRSASRRGSGGSASRPGWLDPDRLVVIPNGVDPAPFDRSPSPSTGPRSASRPMPSSPSTSAGSTRRRG